jgi:hypothetical protein
MPAFGCYTSWPQRFSTIFLETEKILERNVPGFSFYTDSAVLSHFFRSFGRPTEYRPSESDLNFGAGKKVQAERRHSPLRPQNVDLSDLLLSREFATALPSYGKGRLQGMHAW